jgi:pimeloyl-ACP methyl ester carboxylesterase
MLQFATKPMMQRRDTFIDGVRLAYLEHGAARVGSPSLLLFHGLIANAESFSMLAACRAITW